MMEISRAHSSFRWLRHHERELPDEEQSYTTIRIQSRAEALRRCGRARAAASIHAGRDRLAARAERVQPAAASRDGVPASAHGRRGVFGGPDAQLRVAAGNLRPSIWLRSLVSVPE